MGTFLVKDDFPRHARFVDVDDAAIGVWSQALAYANEQETDGFIPKGALRWISRSSEDGALKIVAQLVAAGLLEEVHGGWRLHDYLQHNPSREAREAKRAAARGRMASRELRAKDPRSASEGSAKQPEKNKRSSREPPEKLPSSSRELQGSQDQDQVRADPDRRSSSSVDPDPGTTRAHDPPPDAAAAGHAGKPNGASHAHMDRWTHRALSLLAAHPELAGLAKPGVAAELAGWVLADERRAQFVEQGIADVATRTRERGLEGNHQLPTIAMLRGFIGEAMARSNRPPPARSQTRAVKDVQSWENVRPAAPLPPADLPPPEPKAS